MKIYKIFILLGLIVLTSSCQSDFTPEKKTSSYELAITKQRIEWNEKMKNPQTSILEKDSIAGFSELNYYPVDEKWNIHARFEKLDSSTIFEMITTTDRVIPMKTEGKITFLVDGKVAELFAYRNMEYPKEDLFVPFLDLTNGSETYGGGRYLEIEDPVNDSVWIDFNTAYNPYCAYNHSYSCPIPPLENTLELEITSGEKVLYTY